MPTELKDCIAQVLRPQHLRMDEAELMRHPFFIDIDWEALNRKAVPPICPPANAPSSSSRGDAVDSVLDAAALTYVAAAVASLLQLLYFLVRSGILGGRR